MLDLALAITFKVFGTPKNDNNYSELDKLSKEQNPSFQKTTINYLEKILPIKIRIELKDGITELIKKYFNKITIPKTSALSSDQIYYEIYHEFKTLLETEFGTEMLNNSSYYIPSSEFSIIIKAVS